MGSGLQQLVRALQCTDCIASSSPLSLHSSSPLLIKTSFFLLLSFSGVLSDRLRGAGEVILPLVFSLEGIYDTGATGYFGLCSWPALQDIEPAHRFGGKLPAICEHIWMS